MRTSCVLVLLILCIAPACLRSEATVCRNGLTCPPDATCDEAKGRCIAREQIAQCAGKLDGDECAYTGLRGDCVAGVCEPWFCGSGVRNRTELCDGDDLGGATCITAGFYNPEGLACSAFCTYDITNCREKCGDNIKNGLELCDGTAPTETCVDIGRDAGTLSCSSGCAYVLDNCAQFGWRFSAVLPPAFYTVIHGSGPNDIWALGLGGAAAHFDGAQWTAATTGTVMPFLSVSTIAPDSAWAIDAGSEVHRWNGTAWQTDATAPSDARAVYATSASNVLIATTNNGVRRFDGTSWSALGTLAQTNLNLLHGVADDDVWAATGGSEVVHWNGASWAARPIPGSVDVYRLHAVGPDEAWIIGYDNDSNAHLRGRWRAGQWELDTAGSLVQYTALAGTAPNDVWILNENFEAQHYDGRAWLSVEAPATAAMLALAPGDVLLLSSQLAYRFQGQAYAEPPPAPGIVQQGMWVSDTGHIFLPSSSGVAHYDSTTWTTAQSVSTSSVIALWGTAHDDVWAIGLSGTPVHFDGGTWAPASVTNTQPLYAIWGSAANDVWAGGNGGVVLHFDGSTWSNRDIPAFSPSSRLVALAGSGPNDVWAVGQDGSGFHWTGSWAPVTLPGSGSAADMVVTAPGEAILARDGHVYHLASGTWTEAALPNVGFTPLALSAAARDDVFGVSYGNYIFHFDGAQWSLVRIPDDTVNAQLVDVAARPHRIDLMLADVPTRIRTLLRTEPWACEASEVGRCTDSVDNDCDGLLDVRDSDCP